MFAPDQRAVAAELARVTRPGGRLALLNWHPSRGVAESFKMMAPYLPPSPEGAGNPSAWGDRDRHVELLRRGLRAPLRGGVTVPQPGTSAEHVWELFTTAHGPTKALADSLDAERRAALRRDWIATSTSSATAPASANRAPTCSRSEPEGDRRKRVLPTARHRETRDPGRTTRGTGPRSAHAPLPTRPSATRHQPRRRTTRLPTPAARLARHATQEHRTHAKSKHPNPHARGFRSGGSSAFSTSDFGAIVTLAMRY
jgi:hypothetical protein